MHRSEIDPVARDFLLGLFPPNGITSPPAWSAKEARSMGNPENYSFLFSTSSWPA
jgi:hypothetical protein